jgi:hypothetical protein
MKSASILMLLFLVPLLFGQEDSKGTISLIFHDEEINLPINKVSIQKDEGIVLRFEANNNNAEIQQRVSIQIGLKKLSAEKDAETLEGTRLDIYTRNNKTKTGRDLSVWLDDKETDNELNKSEGIHYSIFNKGERVSWEINAVSLKINITEVKYADAELQISGELEGNFKSTLAPEGQVAEIKECKFNVKI